MSLLCFALVAPAQNSQYIKGGYAYCVKNGVKDSIPVMKYYLSLDTIKDDNLRLQKKKQLNELLK